MAAALLISRVAAVAFATAGLFLCPFRCAEASAGLAEKAVAPCSAGEGCSDCHDGCGDSSPEPADECPGDCVGKALPDGAAKVSAADLDLLRVAIGETAVVPVSVAGLASSVSRDASLTHPNADSGMMLRLVFSSLLV